MGIKAFLSKNEKHDLISFIAGTGENYNRYSEYADSRGWKKFSPAYFHKWVHRNKPAIKMQRALHVEEVRRISMYDREKRIASLEDALMILDSHIMDRETSIAPHKCDYCGMVHEIEGPEVVIKLLEQKRKILEQIAKERNEWLKQDDRGGTTGLIEGIRSLARAELADRLSAAKIVSEETKQDGLESN